MQLSLDELRAIVDTLRAGNVGEFEYEDEQVKLRLSFGVPSSGTALTPTVTYAMAPPAVAAAATPIAATTPAPGAEELGCVFVTSPFVGTFYRSSSPDSKAFAEVGSDVRKGQSLCIVEAMKLMNEIESEVSGVVVELLVENGSSVEYGQKLFKVRTA